VVWLVVLGALVFLTVYDLRWLLLPDVVQLPTILLVGAWLAVISIATHSGQFGIHHLLAAVIGGAAFYLLASLAGGKLMGGGDVKLIFLMGLLLGMQNLLLALVVSFNVAAIVGITLLATGIKKRRDPLPFGPFLALGTLVAFLYGAQIIGWYLRLNGAA
jgi:prepilin signal peptidase PulO-like enzyme (type II secretory pathway)